MSYDQIMVMGAGAVGGYFGGRLSERTPSEVTMIARGAHLEAMQRRGLEIKSPEGDVMIDVPAYESPQSTEQPDLILFTVKSYDTESAINKIEPVVSARTQILTIQNGIENYEKLVERFGEKRVIQGFCRIGASITEPGVIEHRSMGSVVVGEPDGRRSERLQRLKELFAGTGIDFSISGDIRHDIWVKFTWNSIYNMVTGIAMVTVDKLHRFPASRRLCSELFEEIRELAATQNVVLTDGDKETILRDSENLVGFTTSTYNDRSKGKKMEYEAFTGAIVRLAEAEQIEVPHHETLYGLLKLIDGS